MSDVRDLNDFIQRVFEGAMGVATELLVDQATEGLSVEERLRRVEIQSMRNEGELNALRAAVSESESLQAKVDDMLLSTTFALAGHVLGRTFTPEEIDEISTAALDAAPNDRGNGLHLGEYVANAVREKIYNG